MSQIAHLPPRVRACIEIVARSHGVLAEDILSPWQDRYICWVRRIAIEEVSRFDPRPSVAMIARWFGRHESVVRRSIGKAQVESK